MTRKEYENLLETEEGREQIVEMFDGCGVYKADIPYGALKDADPDEIVYIPENGFEYLDTGDLDVYELCFYTVQDLIDMFNGNVEAVEVFFDTLDWSFPSTLFDEEYNNGEIKYCPECDKFYYDYWNKECQVCGTRYDNADNDY